MGPADAKVRVRLTTSRERSETTADTAVSSAVAPDQATEGHEQEPDRRPSAERSSQSQPSNQSPRRQATQRPKASGPDDAKPRANRRTAPGRNTVRSGLRATAPSESLSTRHPYDPGGVMAKRIASPTGCPSMTKAVDHGGLAGSRVGTAPAQSNSGCSQRAGRRTWPCATRERQPGARIRPTP
jgi:hypothetical protein